ncbi:endonuclease domain-containing protein [Mycobacterium sp. EPa45]|uniref:endonuclease domain-containing protein n=1 Tax=Mycobacterium sp. EPa45 TaxID=1545728 RepID=UPI00064246D9|nr:DUF559 domain-containing protein [Mycobacterium sp. EPa45]AKK26124.1 hypothetical protein AB431_04795 [Mycobacterium sp. EPa45]
MHDEPFLGTSAISTGQVTDYQLRTRYRAVYRNVYLANEVKLTALRRAQAVWLFAGPDVVLAGISAAAVHGTKWLDGAAPAEIIRADRHAPKGIVARSYAIADDQVCTRRGMRVTTAPRTAFDIGRSLPLDTAVPILDALMKATRLHPNAVLAIADASHGVRGVRRLRAAMKLADGGAESPQETRLRLLLIGAGLPAPETQIEFFDAYGDAMIRVDMGWRKWQVAVEYDGVQHWADGRQRSWDIDRIAILESMGWAVVRVSADMLRRPQVIIERVTAKLRAAGCPL